MSDAFSTNEQAWAGVSAWATGQRMNEVEALMWRSERHPRFSSTITSLLIYDTTPDWDRLYAAHEWASELLPRCRQRVLEPALPVGPPAWVVDETFDLRYHLRRMHLPDPGSMTQLLELTEQLALEPFDRTRPLWQATLIEGLTGGRAAYVLKMHHSMTDGLGGVQLMSLMQSRTREHTADKPTAPPPPAASSDPGTLALAEVTEQARRLPSLARRAVTRSVHATLHPTSALADVTRYGASLRRTLSPPPAPPSPLLGDRAGTSWKFGVLECPAASLRAAAGAAHGSMNDAYIAALLGGLRRYHEHHQQPVDRLPVTIPVSLRATDDPMGGNKFAGAYIAAHVGTVDPAERIATIRGTVLSLRIEPALDTLALAAPVLNRSPHAVSGALFDRIGSAADLSASTVPGVPYATYMAGAQVQRIFPFGPLPGVAIMAAMISHHGTCCIALNIDGDAVPDPGVLIECIRLGLEEVLAIAR